MQCPRCQQAANPGALFCGNCGLQFAMGPGDSIQGMNTPTHPPLTPPLNTNPSDQPPSEVQTPSTPQPNLQQPAVQTLPPQPLAAQSTTNAGVQASQDHSGKAIASFVLGVLGLPATLIPIAGVVFAILAIVFGSLSLHSTRKIFAKIGIGIGIFVLLVSVFFWVKATQDILKAKQTGTAVRSSSSSLQQTIKTPCYTTKIPASMEISQAEGSCTFQGIDAARGEQVVVKVLQIPQLTAATLATAATSDAKNVVGVIPGGSIDKQAAATFAGSQAYTIEIVATDGSAGTISYVYDETPQGNLVIILHTQAKAAGADYDLNSIESEWAWL